MAHVHFQAHLGVHRPVVLGGAPDTSVWFGDLNSEMSPGGEFVQIMARHVGVQFELFGNFACGHTVGVLVDIQIDISSGDVAKSRGYRRDRRSELCRAEVLGVHDAILRMYDRDRSRSD